MPEAMPFGTGARPGDVRPRLSMRHTAKASAAMPAPQTQRGRPSAGAAGGCSERAGAAATAGCDGPRLSSDEPVRGAVERLSSRSSSCSKALNLAASVNASDGSSRLAVAVSRAASAKRSLCARISA